VAELIAKPKKINLAAAWDATRSLTTCTMFHSTPTPSTSVPNATPAMKIWCAATFSTAPAP